MALIRGHESTQGIGDALLDTLLGSRLHFHYNSPPVVINGKHNDLQKAWACTSSVADQKEADGNKRAQRISTFIGGLRDEINKFYEVYRGASCCREMWENLFVRDVSVWVRVCSTASLWCCQDWIVANMVSIALRGRCSRIHVVTASLCWISSVLVTAASSTLQTIREINVSEMSFINHALTHFRCFFRCHCAVI